MAEETGPGRSFQPVTEQDLKKPEPPKAPGVPGTKPATPPASRGVPTAHVNPEVAREFGEEIITKVTTGRKRMRWFANHVILFVVGIAVAISLKMTIYEDIDQAVFLVLFGVWVGVLVVHANYALSPMLKRSRKESQIKAVMGPKGAVEIIFRGDLGDKAKIEARTEEYRDRFANPFIAGHRGFIDDVIMPHNTRARIAKSLRMLKNKKLDNPWKKHGNIPL